MHYRLEMEERGDYLYAYVTGRDSQDVSLAFWKEAVESCLKLNHEKLLVEEDLEGAVSIVDAYEIVSAVMKIPGASSLKIALVDRHPSDENAFGETVAQNRGATGRLFSTVEDAEEWLRSIPAKGAAGPRPDRQ